MTPHEFTPLPRGFFEPAADLVAPRLLGHWLIRQTPDGPCGGAIVETEAYCWDDASCHAFKGETKRNRSMFGPPGHAYVYFIYGVHYCINAVCHQRGVGEAVLIRAIEPDFSAELMQERRGVVASHQLTNGPGKLCAALGISRSLDGADLCDSSSPVFVALNPNGAAFRRARGPLLQTRRIGLSRAAHLPLRFCLAGSAFVSRGTAGSQPFALTELNAATK